MLWTFVATYNDKAWKIFVQLHLMPKAPGAQPIHGANNKYNFADIPWHSKINNKLSRYKNMCEHNSWISFALQTSTTLVPVMAGWKVPSHYLNQCWLAVNWTTRNNLQWNLDQNTRIFISFHFIILQITFGNVVFKMSAIFEASIETEWCIHASAHKAIIASDNGLWLVWYKVIIRINDGFLLIRP